MPARAWSRSLSCRRAGGTAAPSCAGVSSASAASEQGSSSSTLSTLAGLRLSPPRGCHLVRPDGHRQARRDGSRRTKLTTHRTPRRSPRDAPGPATRGRCWRPSRRPLRATANGRPPAGDLQANVPRRRNCSRRRCRDETSGAWSRSRKAHRSVMWPFHRRPSCSPSPPRWARSSCGSSSSARPGRAVASGAV
jgi:hypothetical protein